ncbi:hypothetical protein BB560_004715 [Smittium megazygosporum]|uniref:GH16 domain-containing protein n=1 Tax=Smittium megazygosporum TaxID=133381 RepID=A0A2T9Z8G2_9FUNG|nr:hypothetical protein BB560_004715 [Smittium megazygosporum]
MDLGAPHHTSTSVIKTIINKQGVAGINQKNKNEVDELQNDSTLVACETFLVHNSLKEVDQDREDVSDSEEKQLLFSKIQDKSFRILRILSVLIVFLVPIILLISPIQGYLRKKRDFAAPSIEISETDMLLFLKALEYNKFKQELNPKQLPIDLDTPKARHNWKSADGIDYKLVFSDEFNQEGRDFRPGKDKYWESQELWYWFTENLEYFDHKHTQTRNGNLEVTLDEYSSKPELNYTGGMLNSWNKFCFQGGYMEVNVSFPGDGRTSGLWPAVWLLGNLGRAGYGATVDGLWPYSYDQCDAGVLPNQGNLYASSLPGQRLNACVCKGDHPSPGIGRGAPEIDLFEKVVSNGIPSLSMSLQIAPFDYHSRINDSNIKIYNPGSVAPGFTRKNDYLGDDIQQAVSALHFISPEVSGGRKFQVFGVEYETGPNGYIRWYSENKPVWFLGNSAIGGNKYSKISQREIPREPMYIIMNLSLSKRFGVVEWERLKFPATLYIDYVRVYQQPNKIRISCDPDDRPTRDYILNHPRAYFNVNYTKWEQTGYELPRYSLKDRCRK